MEPKLCPECGISLHSLSALRLHNWNKHRVLPPGKKLEDMPSCDHCGEKFFDGVHLRRHMAIHENKRLHRCPLCDHRANLYHCLHAHLKNIHHITAKRKFQTEVDYTKDTGMSNELIRPRPYILYDTVDGREIGRNFFNEADFIGVTSSTN
jgi:ribosomal protein L34E